MEHDPESVLRRLFACCRDNEWSGYDPYDALNSKWFQSSPLASSRLARLALIQAVKRSPINFRNVLQVPKTANPKGIALILSAALKAPELCSDQTGEVSNLLAAMLIDLRSPESPYWCWGYSFPWQTRTVLVPRYAPNLVCTAFVADSLLELYVQRRDERYLEIAVSAADYLLDKLYWSDSTSAGFSYPLPSVRNQVHNANFLAASLLCRVYKITGYERFLEPALRAARYSAAQQREDGSWYYGESSTQHWIDNFHTGFNLCALRAMADNLETAEFAKCMERGFEFYRKHFICEDGAPRYFHDRTYPIDIHCGAQSIITLLTFQDFNAAGLALANSVFHWLISNMWDEKGYFYYRVLRIGRVRTSYMRWSQAWMLLALAHLVHATETGARRPAAHESSRLVSAC